MNKDDKQKAIVEAAQAIKSITDNWVTHVESIRLQARMTKAKYDAYRAEGFSESEALYLVGVLK
jgi:hypothetical protein